MEYNIKLSKGKININGKDYDISGEVAEFIIYEISTRDDIIQTRDVYERAIDKAIEYINKNLIVLDILNGVKNFGLNSYSFDYKELLDILMEVR